jgi:hypothetical protein
MFKSFTITSFILKKIENLNVYLFHNKKLSALRGSKMYWLWAYDIQAYFYLLFVLMMTILPKQ